MADTDKQLHTGEPWIGVDFDGTLAYYDGWEGPQSFGKAIPIMLNRVKVWIAEGRSVKILTARVGYSSIMDDPNVKAGRDNYQDLRQMITFSLQDWCEENGLPRLDVTAEKDYLMTEFWDDRATQVVPNKGFSVMELMERDPRNALAGLNPDGVAELVAAAELIVEHNKSMIARADNCGSYDAECPMQDYMKAGDLLPLTIRLEQALTALQETE